MGLLRRPPHLWLAFRHPASVRCFFSFNSSFGSLGKRVEIQQGAPGLSHLQSLSPYEELLSNLKSEEEEDADQWQWLCAPGEKLGASPSSSSFPTGIGTARESLPASLLFPCLRSYGCSGSANNGDCAWAVQWQDGLKRVYHFGSGLKCTSLSNSYDADLLNSVEFSQFLEEKQPAMVSGPLNGLGILLVQRTGFRKCGADLSQERFRPCSHYSYSSSFNYLIENPGFYPRGLRIEDITIEADSVKRKRKKKMNKHKHRKLRRRLRRLKKKR